MHSPLRLGVLALLVSLPVAAQSLDPWSEPPTSSEPSPPGTRTQVPEPALGLSLPQPPLERWTPAARVGAELGGGVLGSLVGGLVGGGAGFLVTMASCSDRGLCKEEPLVHGTVLGAGIGTSLGIALGGGAAGGNGSGWAAAGGVALGIAALGIVARTGQEQLVLPLALVTPVLGVLGYELTDRAPGPQIAPGVTFTPEGGSLGLQGRF